MKIPKNVNGEKLLKRTQLNDHPLPSVRLAQPPQGAHGKGSPGHETRTTCRRHGGVIEIVAE